MSDAKEKEKAYWFDMLEQHRHNLREQRKQNAIYAKGEERLALLNQIIASEEAIRGAKENLRWLGVEPPDLPIDPPEEFGKFVDQVIETYPLPIAQACDAFNQANEMVRRFVALDRLISSLIKYLAAIFIGQARRDRLPEYPLPERLEWIAKPILQNWTDTISELGQIYKQPSRQADWLLRDLLFACTRPLLNRQELMDAVDYLTIQLSEVAVDEPSVVDFLRLLARYRDREWNDAVAQYSPDKIRPLILRLQPALAVLLNELESLRRYPLVYIERVDKVDLEVRLRMVKFMGRSTEDIPVLNKPPFSLPQDLVEHIKRKRFFVMGDDVIPQLDLHPFFVLWRWEMYELDRHKPTDFVEFRSCIRGTRFCPPPEARTYHASWLQDMTQEPPAEDIPSLFGEDEEWMDKVSPVPSDELSEPIPLTWLTQEGREALEIALGEALRIGRFWLGVEFLLMGLSKQLDCVFPRVLLEIGIKPGKFRGALRGIVGVVKEKEQDWQKMDAQKLGAEALPHIRTVDPDELRESFGEVDQPISVITPRMTNILEEAIKISGEGQIGHNHLLLAVLKNHRAFPVRLLFTMAYQAGWPAKRVLSRISELT